MFTKKNYNFKSYCWFAFNFTFGCIMGTAITVILTFASCAVLLTTGASESFVNSMIPYTFWLTLIGMIYIVWFVTSEDAFI